VFVTGLAHALLHFDLEPCDFGGLVVLTFASRRFLVFLAGAEHNGQWDEKDQR
jgi:hypothetical protein